MPFSSLTTGYSAVIVGRTPRSAADALVGLQRPDTAVRLGQERVQGDPRGPGGPPHKLCRILVLRKLNDIGLKGALKGRTWYRAPSRIGPCVGRNANHRGRSGGSHMPVRISDADNSESAWPRRRSLKETVATMSKDAGDLPNGVWHKKGVANFCPGPILRASLPSLWSEPLTAP